MRKYTREQLTFFLKELAEGLKKTPTSKEMDSSKYPSSTTYAKRFGTWNRALQAAGLRLNLRKAFSENELCENLRIITREIGRPPRPADLKGRAWAGSYTTYAKYFSSWKEALAKSGIRQETLPTLKTFSKIHQRN